MVFQKLQQHTIDIYNLSSKKYQIKTVKARTLLTSNRFDLFAKLYYIANRIENYDKAIKVYKEHIKTFNPDLKEPGRTDKNTVEDFIKVFDNLISEFNETEFNDDISIIPVDSKGVILDGAHRVAALTYYDKYATIVQFEDVIAKCDFNYSYFKNRGLNWKFLDIIAHEMIKWLPNLLVACVWPRVNNLINTDFILNYLLSKYEIAYIKEFNVGLSSLTNFVHLIYHEQEWTNNANAVKDKAINCYSNTNRLTLIFFESTSNLDSIIKDKSIIRNKLNCENHSIHITDNQKETIDISKLVNTVDGQNLWYKKNKFTDKIKEQCFYFKNVHWLNFKIRIAAIINKLK